MKKSYIIMAALAAIIFVYGIFQTYCLAYDMGMSHVILDSRIYTDGNLIFIEIDEDLWVHE